MVKRRGMGKGKGMGYYNIAPMDSYVHAMSAKGVKSTKCEKYPKTQRMKRYGTNCVFCGREFVTTKNSANDGICMSCRNVDMYARGKKIDGKFYVPVETFGDLHDMDIDEVKKVLKSMGAEVKKVPKVSLGNLTLDNLNIDYTEPLEYYVLHKDGSRSFPMMFNPSRKIEQEKGDKLVVEAVGREESLMKYANMIKKEYADMSDKELKEYSPLGNKRYARAQDELLRRGLKR